jgi:hypothetical protein
MAKKIDWNAVTTQMANTGKKTYTDDNAVENLFQPKLKEDGTYDAIIRFLPSPDTDLPFVAVYSLMRLRLRLESGISRTALHL